MVAEGPAQWSPGNARRIRGDDRPAGRSRRGAGSMGGMSRLWLLPLAVGAAGGGLLAVANQRLTREIEALRRAIRPLRARTGSRWARRAAQPGPTPERSGGAHMGRAPLHSP